MKPYTVQKKFQNNINIDLKRQILYNIYPLGNIYKGQKLTIPHTYAIIKG